MPSDDVKHYLEKAKIIKEHNIKTICELLRDDEAFCKAVVNYSKSARSDADWL